MALELHVSDWQAEFIESTARYRIAAVGRRGGKNEAANTDQIEYARQPQRSEWGADESPLCWWVGPTYDQARKWGFEKALNKIPSGAIDGEPKRTEPYEIDLTNGATLEYRTFDKPESLQGAGVDHLVIDEAAYMPRSLWDNDLRPMLLDSRGQAVLISKPLGRGWFHEMYERGNSNDWQTHESFHATSADNPFIEESPAETRGDIPDHVYKQEYLAEFVDESGGVFTDLDDSLFTADYSLPVDGVDPHAVGVDFARHQDYRVTLVLDATGDIVYFDRAQNEAWPHIQSDIEDVAADYPGVVFVDGSRDNKIVADLAGAGVNVNPVTFSPKRKRELIEDLVTRIENGELTAPEIPQLRHELGIFEYDVTPAGNVRYQAPEGFHDDTVDALALAASALDRLDAHRRRRDDSDEDANGVSYL